MGVVFERQRRQLQLARSLHIDSVEPVDQDVGNGGVLEQRFERPKTKNLVKNLARQALALGKAQGDGFALDRIANDDEDFVASGIAGLAQFFQVETVEDLAVQVRFYLLVIGALEGLQIRLGALDFQSKDS